MTAETFTAVVRPASTFSLKKYPRGSAPIGSAGATALAALTSTSTVAQALDILSAATKTDFVVAADSMGRASHVDA